MANTACDKNEPQKSKDNVRQDITLTKAQSEICSVTNDFTFDFMKTLASLGENQQNVFASPFSLQTVLAMVAEGAEGSTRDEIYEALRLSGIDKDEIAGFFRYIIPSLEGADNTTVMEIANSFWAKQSIEIKDDYAAKLKTSYYAETRNLSFDGKVAARDINKWCSDKTHGMINKIVDTIEPDLLVSLINAIYFKGEWATKFNSANNYKDTFHNFDGNKTEVTLMNRRSDMYISENEDAAAVSLNYGNGAYGMTVILPHKDVNVNDVLAKLDAESWKAYRFGGDKYNVNLSFPKFETEYTAEDICIKALNEMGMAKAFTPAAEFSGISDTRLCIDQVIHKAKIKVNEKGTEAAAVSYVGMKLATAVSPTLPYEFKVDRPFIYAISEVSTGTIVFIGVQRNF